MSGAQKSCQGDSNVSRDPGILSDPASLQSHLGSRLGQSSIPSMPSICDAWGSRLGLSQPGNLLPGSL